MQEADLFAALAARDEGISRVEHHNVPWADLALEALKEFPRGITGTSEDFRLALWRAGLEEPRHHNAWGALTMKAVRAGIFVPTGEYRSMKTEKSHARKTAVYRLA